MRLARLMSSSDEDASAHIGEFTGRVALLLKHDWECAKIESSWLLRRKTARPAYATHAPTMQRRPAAKSANAYNRNVSTVRP